MPLKEDELREGEGVWHKVLMVFFKLSDRRPDSCRGFYGFYCGSVCFSTLRGGNAAQKTVSVFFMLLIMRLYWVGPYC